MRRTTVTSALLAGLLCLVSGSAVAAEWARLTPFDMEGGLAAYWNVVGMRSSLPRQNALRLGFRPITLINTYSDYPGNQRENINSAIGKNPDNPWRKPPFFEKVVKHNLAIAERIGVSVADIEFSFEQDASKAWAVHEIRQASGAKSFEVFERDYFREWASWFALPCKWLKDMRPDEKCGIYGPQPFRRDYWGIAGKTAAQIDGTHARDADLWQHIDPFVDFYIASVYVFYDRPDSVFYIAANVEGNHQVTRTAGSKPVLAYTWLRFHDSNMSLRGREVPTYLAEAMAIVPFFSGAKAVVLWGFEPNWKPDDGPPYVQLDAYTRALARVAKLSGRIGAGMLVVDAPAHQLWNARQPLVRHLVLADGSCVVMAMHPWQDEQATAQTTLTCGGEPYSLTMHGRRATLAVLKPGGVELY